MKSGIFRAILASFTALCLLIGQAGAVNDSHILTYTDPYDAQAYPPNQASAAFTQDKILLDGLRDDGYGIATSSSVSFAIPINKEYHAPASGVLTAVWNGPLLYLLVEVKDTTRARTPTEEGPTGDNPAAPGQTDSVTFAFDLYNDKVNFGTDTTGAFTVDANGKLHFFHSGMISSQSSVLADPEAPEYTGRLAGWAATETDEGYNVEIGLHLEELGDLQEYHMGLEVVLNDAHIPSEAESILPEPSGDPFAPAPKLPSTVDGRVFWSHQMQELYAVIDESNPNGLDWGVLTLTGWDGTAPFAYSDWRITNTLRYIDSLAFAKGVYTEATQRRLDEAVARAQELLDNSEKDKAQTDTAADELLAALKGLRWADERYPDPFDLPEVFTLPDPYRFFLSERRVETVSDWAERRLEILDLAQFYEYGYKPDAPESLSVEAISHFEPGEVRSVLFWGFWPMDVPVTCPTDIVTVRITDHGVSATLDFTVYLPTQVQLLSAGVSGKSPVVLSYDGDNETYRNAGFAVVEVPSGSGGDGRTNEYAWGVRTGAFYELYPYSRNGKEALKEVSSEMAAAWSASRVLDALAIIADSSLPYADEIAAGTDADRAAVSGFSINGKYAFVAAVFDERIDVCIPGAAGATGPSPWRYVYTGHVYDWTNTLFAPGEGVQAPALQVSWGTETLGNSVRHNRVRETEVFRKFLTPGNFYQRLPGAWGYAARLPFDQNDLVSTLAPRAIVLVNTVNDYNDGCEADALGLEAAKSVYRNLGYDADELVKFNYRSVQDGDPHGTDTLQTKRTAEYLRHYFFGTQLTDDVAHWLNTDPFLLPVSEGASPFETYYGGFNTITGGHASEDGWYFTKLKD